MLDYLCQSSTSSPPPDQPGHGDCVCTSLPLFAAHPRVQKLIDEAHDPLDLHPTPVLHNSRALVIISVFRFACAWTDGPNDAFDMLMNQIVESKVDINIFNFSSNFEDGEELGRVNEWILIALARTISGCNEDMHISLARDFAALTPSSAGSLGAVHLDIMQSAALFEVLCPGKFAIFDAEHGPLDLISSKQHAFAPLHPLESKSWCNQSYFIS